MPRSHGRGRVIPTFAWKGETEEEFWWCIDQTIFGRTAGGQHAAGWWWRPDPGLCMRNIQELLKDVAWEFPRKTTKGRASASNWRWARGGQNWSTPGLLSGHDSGGPSPQFWQTLGQVAGNHSFGGFKAGPWLGMKRRGKIGGAAHGVGKGGPPLRMGPGVTRGPWPSGAEEPGGLRREPRFSTAESRAGEGLLIERGEA